MAGPSPQIWTNRVPFLLTRWQTLYLIFLLLPCLTLNICFFSLTSTRKQCSILVEAGTHRLETWVRIPVRALFYLDANLKNMAIFSFEGLFFVPKIRQSLKVKYIKNHSSINQSQCSTLVKASTPRKET